MFSVVLISSFLKSLKREIRRFFNSSLFEILLKFLRRKKINDDAVRSIIIIRPDHLGDFILTTPIFRALKRKFPTAKIHLFVSKVIFPLATGCPDIDTVVEIPKGFTYWCPYFEIPLFKTMWIAWFTFRRIRSLQPDIVILPRVEANCYGSIWIVAFSGANQRVAFAESTTQWRASYNKGSDRVFTDIVQTSPNSHEVKSLRALAHQMELSTDDWKTYLWWSPRDNELVGKIITRIGDSPAIIFGPGASDERRRWPASSFGEVARGLESRGFRILIVGGPSDFAIGEEILAYLTPELHLNLAGKLSLQQTAATRAYCNAFVGNDSGPMHMAAAVQLPCVEISSFPENGDNSHVNSPHRFGPWAVRSIVLQPKACLPPCGGYCRDSKSHCICQIMPDQVINAVCNLVRISKKA